jgi:hypothetical protein
MGHSHKEREQLWIVAIDGFVGRDTAIRIEGTWEKERLYAIVQTSSKGAVILDNAYRTRAEAKEAWPEAE